MTTSGFQPNLGAFVTDSGLAEVMTDCISANTYEELKPRHSRGNGSLLDEVCSLPMKN